jgi:hypothetical protein
MRTFRADKDHVSNDMNTRLLYLQIRLPLDNSYEIRL